MKFNGVFNKILTTLGIIIAYLTFGVGIMLFCIILIASFIENELLSWLFLTVCIGIYLFGALYIIFNMILNKIWGLKNIQFLFD